MSRRGASLPARSTEFEFREVGSLGRPIVALAKQLRASGLTSAEICSLFTQTAAVLARQQDGLSGRSEWLSLARELFDELGEGELALTAPGGEA